MDGTTLFSYHSDQFSLKVRISLGSIFEKGNNTLPSVFSNSSRLEAVHCNFFPERECIGNYPSKRRGVLTVYKFNTLPLKKNSYSLLYMTTVFRYKTFVCLQLFFVCELICLTWQESPKQSSSLSPLVHQRFSAQPACSSWSWSSPTSRSSPTF